MSRPLYSIVVPVYKSEKTLRELYERVDKAFALLDADYELILVEDCGGMTAGGSCKHFAAQTAGSKLSDSPGTSASTTP
jgi:hypothetical protein